MTKMFDRFLKNPDAVSCGQDSACCGSQGDGESACSAPRLPSLKTHPWVTGAKATPAGDVPLVTSKLRFADRAGSWRARWGIGRMRYSVPPGLYGIGSPDAHSPVFVTANYKMTFDRVRASLRGRDGWILVLDTKGINVWCAAGKGTFGTDEIVRRVEMTGLARAVNHRTLILPQLGAPGVAAHEVTRRTKFRVIYGPVRAEDIPAFLDAGMTATPAMRKVSFTLRDRIVLIPEEVVAVLVNKVFWVILAVWALGLAGVKIFSLDMPAILGAILVGTVVVPLLLPWIPVRPFALKGWLLGIIGTVAYLAAYGLPVSPAGWVSAASSLLLLPAVSAFLAMGFTGTSTITSLSGVVKEMKTAVPLMIASAALGVAAMITSAFL